MPLFQAQFISLQTPAHTFRSVLAVSADARLEISEDVPLNDSVTIEFPFPNTGGAVVAVAIDADAPVSLQFRDGSGVAVGDPIANAGGGVGKPVTGGNGSYVWPAYNGQTAPDFLDGGDVADVVVTRGNDGGDAELPVVISLFYDAN